MTREDLLSDYRIAVRSREVSTIGRREVLAGRAPFAIMGDGKEVAQVALAKVVRPGDWRTGSYRDQTFALASGMVTVDQLFAALYADPDVGREPHSGGRQLTNHFATRTIDGDGKWRDLLAAPQSGADLSPVGAAMGHALGLAWASMLYRRSGALRAVSEGFSRGGDEICIATIGNASTSEGIFWEAVNAAGVLQVPMLVNVWDDGWGISVPNELQTTKSSISEALAGFARDTRPGYEIYVVAGWDYPSLIATYENAVRRVRSDHVPALVHVIEMTQPYGHSSSGSHERYKTAERLAFETAFDPIGRMREWLIASKIARADELDEIERDELTTVERARARAYESFTAEITADRATADQLISAALHEAEKTDVVQADGDGAPKRGSSLDAVVRTIVALRGHHGPAYTALTEFANAYRRANAKRFSGQLLSATSSPRVGLVEPEYSAEAPLVDGRHVLLRFFDAILARDPRIVILGEDVGRLGDVNLVYEGLQAKYGDLRVTDTGIREATIVGQAIGAAMRGLRPIADIQYLDYLLFALEQISDDLATVRFRTAGGQKAPVVIRTKGHRLQGIWHAGSPMQMLLGSMRGIHICVPRDMTEAARMYNTVLRGDDPALVIETLNAYRLKERLPTNVADMSVPLGVPMTLRSGDDLTIVTYGACCRVVMDAAGELARAGIDVEVIDVRTLLPFDVGHMIAASLSRTRALLIVDEDVPGGASAFLMREILDSQDAIDFLDVPARTLTATSSRTPVGTDGDFFTKPQTMDVFLAAYEIVRLRSPGRLPELGVRAPWRAS
jgi:pyruvate/2-oxoglutarate/acetoin dehydrogenase E1 component/TPP-dependent pyruvate/acetoin dehydrogenase alpha subunit